MRAHRKCARACGAAQSRKRRRAYLEIDIDSPGDMFAAALRRGSDLQIQNALTPTIAQRLPRYFTKACPQTSSFIMLPILSENSPIACILGRTGCAGTAADQSRGYPAAAHGARPDHSRDENGPINRNCTATTRT
jgi:hypothetical protein